MWIFCFSLFLAQTVPVSHSRNKLLELFRKKSNCVKGKVFPSSAVCGCRGGDGIDTVHTVRGVQPRGCFFSRGKTAHLTPQLAASG